MTIFRQRLLPVLLAVLAASAWWLNRVRHHPQEAESPDPSQPDQVVEELRATRMNDQGHPHQRLVTPQARHYPNTAGSLLDVPHLTLFAEKGPPWQITSEQGWVSEQGDEIRLQGKVYLDREAGDETPPLEVKTREVTIWPSKEYARTEHPLYATSRSDWLDSAGGGEAWFGETLQAKLFGRVRVEYTPPTGNSPD